MGARDDLLKAARQLTRRGMAPFSPAQLIKEARSFGSTYSDSTLRSFIIGPMCENSPDNHAVAYGDLWRVERAQYILAEDRTVRAERRAPTQPARLPPPTVPATAAPSAMTDRSWEGNIQARVVHHLTSTGWTIERVADTARREQGEDIRASKNGRLCYIEVKGWPSTTYVRGDKAGQPKPTSPGLQARHWFAGALLMSTLLRSEHPDSDVVVALPDRQTYRTLYRRLQPVLNEVAIQVWFVRDDGSVET
ncbi:MAG: DUF7669 domain-containing protein [Ilumatobacteraceae bacterium]